MWFSVRGGGAMLVGGRVGGWEGGRGVTCEGKLYRMHNI